MSMLHAGGASCMGSLRSPGSARVSQCRSVRDAMCSGGSLRSPGFAPCIGLLVGMQRDVVCFSPPVCVTFVFMCAVS